MNRVLLDTSAWVDFLRGDTSARKHVDPILQNRRAAICGPVYAEVLSGATDRASYERLKVLLQAPTWLEPPDAYWKRAAELRFQLARHGVQAHLVDLVIGMTAAEHATPLLTRDRDFEQISRVLPLDLTVF